MSAGVHPVKSLVVARSGKVSVPGMSCVWILALFCLSVSFDI